MTGNIKQYKQHSYVELNTIDFEHLLVNLGFVVFIEEELYEDGNGTKSKCCMLHVNRGEDTEIFRIKGNINQIRKKLKI